MYYELYYVNDNKIAIHTGIITILTITKITKIIQFYDRKLYEEGIFSEDVRNLPKLYLASYLPKHYLAFSNIVGKAV